MHSFYRIAVSRVYFNQSKSCSHMRILGSIIIIPYFLVRPYRALNRTLTVTNLRKYWLVSVTIICDQYSSNFSTTIVITSIRLFRWELPQFLTIVLNFLFAHIEIYSSIHSILSGPFSSTFMTFVLMFLNIFRINCVDSKNKKKNFNQCHNLWSLHHEYNERMTNKKYH